MVRKLMFKIRALPRDRVGEGRKRERTFLCAERVEREADEVEL